MQQSYALIKELVFQIIAAVTKDTMASIVNILHVIMYLQINQTFAQETDFVMHPIFVLANQDILEVPALLYHALEFLQLVP